MLTYKDLITKRRSIRDFKDKPVSQDLLDEILNDTCLAPSASNGQPWEFIVIHDKTLMKKLSNESKKNLVKYIKENPKCGLKKYEKILRDPNFNVFYNAPCLILIVGKNEPGYYQRDCSLAAAYFMFAATARGLGTCWIGLGDNIQDPTIKAAIGLPDNHEIVAPIIIGYPEKIPEASSRKKPMILKTIGI